MAPPSQGLEYVLRPPSCLTPSAHLNVARFSPSPSSSSSSHRRRLLIGASDGTIEITSLNSRRPIYATNVQEHCTQSAAATSGDGAAILEAHWLSASSFAVQTRAGRVLIIDADAATNTTTDSIENEAFSFARMTTDGAGNLLAVPTASRADDTGGSGASAVIDVRSPNDNVAVVNPDKAGALCALQLLGSGAAPLLATGHEDGHVRLFDLRAGGVLVKPTASVAPEQGSNSSRSAAAAGGVRGEQRATPRWRLAKEGTRDVAATTPVLAINLPPDGRGVGACGGATERISVLSVNAAASVDEVMQVQSHFTMREGSGGVNHIAAIREESGALFVTSGWDGRVRLWEAANANAVNVGKPLTLRYHDRGVSMCDVLYDKAPSSSSSSPSLRIASAGRDGRVALWHV
ncbi:hypothetical protein NFJ02_09g139310 [Pycnococcus provasolii]